MTDKTIRKYIDVYYTDPVTIKSGGTISDPIDLGNHTLSGVQVPAGMTGTELTFLGSTNNQDYVPMKTISGDLFTIVVDATASITAINPQDMACVRYLRLVSNASEGADRAITMISVHAATDWDE